MKQYTRPKPERVYVKVTTDFDETGYMCPSTITWEDGRTFKIEKIWPCAFTFLICLSFLLTSSQQVFVCVPRCTEQSDKKKIIPYGFQTPYSLCTGLHRFGTL